MEDLGRLTMEPWRLKFTNSYSNHFHEKYDPDPDPHIVNSWIQIRIKVIRIRNTANYQRIIFYYLGCGGHTEHAEAEAGREEVPAALLQSQPFLRYQI